MQLRAVTFVLTDRDTGACLGRAAIAPEAHYISLEWAGAESVERRLADPDGWRLLNHALHQPLAPEPLEPTHVVVRMLLPTERRSNVAVRYVADRLVNVGGRPVNIAGRPDTMAHLDGVLRQSAV
jgi:hypothetical protein